MAAWYTFDSQIALDPETNNIGKNVAGQVFATTDTAFATPLPVTDLAGVVRTELVADDRGLIEQFRVEGHKVVVWKSGDNKTVLFSIEGALQDVELAKGAAQTAQIASETARDAALAAQKAAEDAAAGATGGGGGVGNGNIFALAWDGVGTQPARKYPTWHPRAGQDIPDAPEVVVWWQQPTKPIGVAQDDDLYTRIG